MSPQTRRYANALLEYAKEEGLEEIFWQAEKFVLDSGGGADGAPEPLRTFLDQIPASQQNLLGILREFTYLARIGMQKQKTEVISAVPLSPEQLKKLEKKLTALLGKRLDITTQVDPSLLGGLRVISGNTVLDDSIKRKLWDMKRHIYEGVYSKQ